MNPDIIIQWALGLMAVAIVALVKDHISIRSQLASLSAGLGTYVTQDRLARLEEKIDGKFSDLVGELRKIAGDLEYLRGRSGG